MAVKNLSLAEEYLSDHFPGFPVMPGVLMLEALTQAGAWLIRDMEDFAHSIIILKQAKTIKYGSFVEPGRQLELRVEMTSSDDREIASFKGVGVIDGQEMVKGRFTLTRYNLRDKEPRAARDRCRRSSAGLRDLYVDPAKGLGRRRAIARRPEVSPRLLGSTVGRPAVGPFLMMLQRFAVLLMIGRFRAPDAAGMDWLPGVGVTDRDDFPRFARSLEVWRSIRRRLREAT